jgi:hypothetical protein
MVRVLPHGAWIKKKTNAPLKWKNYNGRKVYTFNINDVEHLEFEHFPKND